MSIGTNFEFINNFFNLLVVNFKDVTGNGEVTLISILNKIICVFLNYERVLLLSIRIIIAIIKDDMLNTKKNLQGIIIAISLFFLLLSRSRLPFFVPFLLLFSFFFNLTTKCYLICHVQEDVLHLQYFNKSMYRHCVFFANIPIKIEELLTFLIIKQRSKIIFHLWTNGRGIGRMNLKIKSLL